MSVIRTESNPACSFILSQCFEDAAHREEAEAAEWDGDRIDSYRANFEDHFRGDRGLWEVRKRQPGEIYLNFYDREANDASAAVLAVFGDPNLSSGDFVGPTVSNQIRTWEAFSFGRFVAGMRPLHCQEREEMVSAFFVYFNDGIDRDGNGITDNSEIDIEILCSEPHKIYLSIWTDYQEKTESRAERFLKNTRSIDLRMGNYRQTEPGHEGEWGLHKSGTIPEAHFPGFSFSDQFTEIGFEWQTDRVRFFMVVQGVELTLWEFEDREFIPQESAPLYFNIWHPRHHWHNDQPADYPSEDTALLIDWVRYFPIP